MKKVSVIVPAYNTEKYIKECIDSVLNQSYPNIEIILIEDSSTDSTLSILKRCQNNPNIVLLENESNRGVGYSRNKGIDYANGDYLMFVDSDDILESQIVEQLVFSLEQGNANMDMCSYDTFLGRPNNYSENNSSSFEVIDVEKNRSLLDKCGGACWAKLFKRSLFDNLRFPEGIVYEDAPVTFPVMIKARFISYLDYPFYHYRFNLNGITKRSKKGPNKNILDLYFSSLLLDRNYSLVRRNNLLDDKMKELGYNILFLGALDSGFWFQMKKRKEIANSFYALANQRYGYESYQDSDYLKKRAQEVPHFRIRLQYLSIFVLKKHYCLEKSETELVSEIRKYLEGYLSKKKNKCKVKKK